MSLSNENSATKGISKHTHTTIWREIKSGKDYRSRVLALSQKFWEEKALSRTNIGWESCVPASATEESGGMNC